MKSRPRHPEYIYVNEALLDAIEKKLGTSVECGPRYGEYPNIAVPVGEFVKLMKASGKKLSEHLNKMTPDERQKYINEHDPWGVY